MLLKWIWMPMKLTTALATIEAEDNQNTASHVILWPHSTK